MINEDELKTFEGAEGISPLSDNMIDPLLKEQKEQVAQMRAALLSCKKNDITSAKVALQNIAVLQVYHQVARIIRYTEVMDRLEDKLYESIDANLAQMDEFDPATMLTLVKIQGDLQKSMVMSQELLKPYMDIDLESIAPPVNIDETTSFGAAILPKESRNAIRNGAQALLTELRKTENLSEDKEVDGNNSDVANTQ